MVHTADPDLLRAVDLFNGGRFANAESAVRRAIARDAGNAGSFTLLSLCMLAQARSAEAVDAALTARSLAPHAASTHIALAHALHATGRDAEACESARAALHLDPRSSDGLAALAEAAMQVDMTEAERAIALLQQRAPNRSRGHHLRARLDMARGRWQDAERWSREALRCDPNSAVEHANLAVALGRQGREQEAAHHRREAVRLDPQRELARANLHGALRIDEERRGLDGSAPYSARQVAETLSAVAHARSLLAVIHAALRDGRAADYRTAADQALDLISTMPVNTLEERRARVLVEDAVALVDSRRGETASAVQRLMPLRDEAQAVLAPDEWRVFLNNLGLLQLRTGDTAGAITTFSAMVDHERKVANPDTLGRALLNLGAAYAGNGDDVAATACYQESVRIADANGHRERSGTARLNLARVAFRAGDLDGAAAILRDASGLLPSDQPSVQGSAGIVSGGIALRRGDLAGARRILLRDLNTLRRAGDRRVVDGYAFLAEVAAAEGHDTIARLHLARATARAQTVETRRTVARARAAVDGAAAPRSAPARV